MVISRPNPQIIKSDLVLPNVEGRIEDDILCLDPDNYVSITEGWGFMAGKFPGRDAVERLTK